MVQVSRSRSHRANKVLYVTQLKMLLSTGRSPWNQRQVVLWDPVGTPGPPAGPEANASANAAPLGLQEDLSEPVCEEELDASAGVLFPFYDPDTHLLYLAGKVRSSAPQPSACRCVQTCCRVCCRATGPSAATS